MMEPRRRVAVAKPSFDEEEERLVLEVLRSGWVTQGPRVEEFERRFAALVGSADAVAVSSGTTALFLTLHVLGIGAGDEVIVPSLTFIASVNAIVHAGATPVLIDVDPRTYNLDPEAVEAAVTPRTRAIMLVHQLGMPADLDAIDAIGRRHGIHVVEDAACALGSSYKGRPIGGSSNLAAFSFHPRKVVVTGEGGMITTNDAGIAARLRRLRHQGMSISDIERHRADRVINETYPEIGYNCRLSDLHAALGIAQLAKLDLLVARRRAIAAYYGEALRSLPAIEPPFVPDFAEPNYQSYIVRLREGGETERNHVLDEMHRRGIAMRRGLMAVHREAPYRNARIAGSLRHTELATDQTMILPIYAGLRDEEQRYVIESLTEVVSALPPLPHGRELGGGGIDVSGVD
jgi:dTDP-4-amino-4,6-dideoxygalactose transaminase